MPPNHLSMCAAILSLFLYTNSYFLFKIRIDCNMFSKHISGANYRYPITSVYVAIIIFLT